MSSLPRLLRAYRLVPDGSRVAALDCGAWVGGTRGAPRQFRRRVRQMVHYCRRFGPADHLERTGEAGRMDFREYVLGHIAFLNAMHPDLARQLHASAAEIAWDV